METNGPIMDPKPPKGSRYAPISAWGFLGMSLLTAIPLVGVIVTIVWACGGAHNQNRRNFARALILAYLIVTAIALVSYFVFGVSLEDIGTVITTYSEA